MSRDSTDHEAARKLLCDAELYYSDAIAKIDPSKLEPSDRQAFHTCTDKFFGYRREIINYLRKFQGDVRYVRKFIANPDNKEDAKKELLAAAFHTAMAKYQDRTVFQQMHLDLKASVESLLNVLVELNVLRRTIDLPKYRGIFRPAVMAIGGTVVCLLGLASVLIPGLQALASHAVVQGATYGVTGVGALVSAFGFYKLRRARKPIQVDEGIVTKLKTLVADLNKDLNVIESASIDHEASLGSFDSGHRLSHCVPFDPLDLLMFLEFAQSFEALWEAVIVYPKTGTMSPLLRGELSAPVSAAPHEVQEDAGAVSAVRAQAEEAASPV